MLENEGDGEYEIQTCI